MGNRFAVAALSYNNLQTVISDPFTSKLIYITWISNLGNVLKIDCYCHTNVSS